jgi:hypothetical protein
MRRTISVPGFWRDVALAFAALALVLRLAIPPGMMVDPGTPGFTLVVCTGHGPLVLAPDGPPKAPTPRSTDVPCGFAATAAPGIPPPPATVFRPLAVVGDRIVGPFVADLAPGRRLAAPPPPSHAPPEGLVQT